MVTKIDLGLGFRFMEGRNWGRKGLVMVYNGVSGNLTWQKGYGKILSIPGKTSYVG
jgi:hypothetical protein